MARLAFRQCDIERALRAGRVTGIPVVVRIERTTGDLLIGPADAISEKAADPGDYWDRDDDENHG